MIRLAELIDFENHVRDKYDFRDRLSYSAESEDEVTDVPVETLPLFVYARDSQLKYESIGFPDFMDSVLSEVVPLGNAKGYSKATEKFSSPNYGYYVDNRVLKRCPVFERTEGS